MDLLQKIRRGKEEEEEGKERGSGSAGLLSHTGIISRLAHGPGSAGAHGPGKDF